MLENQPSLRLLLKHWLCVLRKGCRRSDEDALDPLHSGLATTTMTPRWSVVYVLRLFDSTRLLPSAASWFISFFSLLFDYLTTLLLYTCIALYLIPSLSLLAFAFFPFPRSLLHPICTMYSFNATFTSVPYRPCCIFHHESRRQYISHQKIYQHQTGNTRAKKAHKKKEKYNEF